MDSSTTALIITAFSLGFIHTIAGPDHYLPFVAMSKSRSWSLTKTINIVIICGLAHVLSSVILGSIGIFTGFSMGKIEAFDGIRGNVAAWMLFSFGIAYVIWGIHRLAKKKTHKHIDVNKVGKNKQMSFWILFTIFFFGPCEPLIFLLMVPSAEHGFDSLTATVVAFTVSTLLTMLVSVLILLKGVSLAKMNKLEKYQHVIAGSTISLCGASILFLGL